MGTSWYIGIGVLSVALAVWLSTLNDDLEPAAPIYRPQQELFLQAAEKRLDLFLKTRNQRQEIMVLDLMGYGEPSDIAIAQARSALNDEQTDLEMDVLELREAIARR